jgi:DNA repair exonuclease SbcCD ATPase subunit
MSGWLLQSIEIKGLRGINNEGDPLILRFKPDCVTSISAQNGVGKSSIFDAVNFAIRGIIPKLDGLPASENSKSYYVNRFHSVGSGHVTLTLVPYAGGNPIAIRVDCASNGSRSVSGPGGTKSEAILRQLDREFVLLDNKTFQSFIDDKDLDRGRAFAGLLGLKQYSDLRQTLQGLERTQTFNNHFETSVLESRRRTATANLQNAQRAAQVAFEALSLAGGVRVEHALVVRELLRPEAGWA